MKRIIFSLMFILSAILLNAQSVQYSNSAGVISTTGVAKDSIVTGTVIQPGGGYPVIVNMALTVTPASGDPRFTYSIEGSIDGTQYVPVASTTVTVDSSAATTTRSKFLSTGSTYPNGIYMPYWRAQIATSDSTSTSGYEVDMNFIRKD